MTVKFLVVAFFSFLVVLSSVGTTSSVIARARPSPTPSAPIETPTPTPEPTAEPSPAPSPTPNSKPSPAPTTLRPEPHSTPFIPGVVDQATIPESLDDPSIQRSISQPIRELAHIRWMIGTWNARSSEERSDGKMHERIRSTYVFATTMNDRYVFGADGKARDYLFITYDPLARHWMMARLENNPSYAIWISEAGWKNDRIEFTSDASFVNGRKYYRRLTIVRKTDRSFTLSREEQLADGSWTPDDITALTKAL